MDRLKQTSNPSVYHRKVQRIISHWRQNISEQTKTWIMLEEIVRAQTKCLREIAEEQDKLIGLLGSQSKLCCEDLSNEDVGSNPTVNPSFPNTTDAIQRVENLSIELLDLIKEGIIEYNAFSLNPPTPTPTQYFETHFTLQDSLWQS
ncbi:hypothetical protein SUGI_0024800 [Cryptomeria japonica]|nr:hypothetical protein SUGI_0024800 [Cryptomeria japonica]